MKTPREILLAHHQAADVKLDAIRQSVVADLSPGSALASANSEINAKTQSRKGAETAETQVGAQMGPSGILLPEAALAAREASSPGVFASLRLGVELLPQKLWRELIWPCRRTWAGLAASWLAIFALNLAYTGSRPTVSAKSAMPPGEMRLALQEQRRVLAEIIGPGSPASPGEPPRRPKNQPRSERRTVATA